LAELDEGAVFVRCWPRFIISTLTFFVLCCLSGWGVSAFI